MTAPIVIRGFLGWGNRKGGLEAYGPGGRWAPNRNGQEGGGDLLGDALEEAGASEGATLLVIAVPRFGDLTVLDTIERAAAEATTVAPPCPTCGGSGYHDLERQPCGTPQGTTP